MILVTLGAYFGYLVKSAGRTTAEAAVEAFIVIPFTVILFFVQVWFYITYIQPKSKKPK